MNLNELENKAENQTNDKEKSLELEPDIRDLLISIVKVYSANEQIIQKIADLKRCITDSTTANKSFYDDRSATLIKLMNDLKLQADSIPVQASRLLDNSIQKMDNIDKLKAILNDKIERINNLVLLLVGIVILNFLLALYILVIK